MVISTPLINNLCIFVWLIYIKHERLISFFSFGETEEALAEIQSKNSQEYDSSCYYYYLRINGIIFNLSNTVAGD